MKIDITTLKAAEQIAQTLISRTDAPPIPAKERGQAREYLQLISELRERAWALPHVGRHQS